MIVIVAVSHSALDPIGIDTTPDAIAFSQQHSFANKHRATHQPVHRSKGFMYLIGRACELTIMGDGSQRLLVLLR